MKKLLVLGLLVAFVALLAAPVLVACDGDCGGNGGDCGGGGGCPTPHADDGGDGGDGGC